MRTRPMALFVPRSFSRRLTNSTIVEKSTSIHNRIRDANRRRLPPERRSAKSPPAILRNPSLMQAAARRPRTNHLDLAQRILDVARQRGFEPGARLAEQQIASLCNVSRTPVRAALRLLTDQGVLSWEPEAGYRLAVDLATRAAVAAELPSTEEDDLAEAILRDRSARRLDEAVTVSGLMRRYSAERKTVLNALKKLSEEQLVERAPGQSWLFRPVPEGPGRAGRELRIPPAAGTRRGADAGLPAGRRQGGAAAAGHGSAAGAARRCLRHPRIPAPRHGVPRLDRTGRGQPLRDRRPCRSSQAAPPAGHLPERQRVSG